MSDIEWRWVDVDGTVSTLRFDQLADALTSQSLPRFVLVWRTGWTEWFSADRVADLARAVGTVHSAPLTAVRITEGATTPPPPPVARYATLAPGHVGTLLQPKHKGPLSTVPPPPPPRPGRPFPRPTPPKGMPAAPPQIVPAPPVFVSSAPIPVRDVMPTLAEEEPVRSPTLRPMAGMPPPPRTIPQPKAPFVEDDLSTDVDLDDDAAADVEDVPDAPAAAPAPAAHTPTPYTATAHLPHVPPPLHSPPPRSATPAPAFQKPVPPAELVTTHRSAADPPVAARRSRGGGPPATLAGASRQAVSRATAISVLIPGTLLLAAALVRSALRAPHAETNAAPSALAAIPSAAASAPGAVAVAAPAAEAPTAKVGCTLKHAAVRLDGTAFFGVPLLAATAPDGTSAAVGFASSKEHAMGITVDPVTLGVTPTFEQTANDTTTLGVVPLAHSGMLAFAVDRGDAKLAFSRTVDATKRFSIGVLPDGFARAIGQKFTMIWPGKSKKPAITTPRVATVPGLGHAVTFRHGGPEGKILVGWLTEAGEKLTSLKAVSTNATIVGTPTVSASDASVLVTFASKLGPAEGFRAELALAGRGGLPEQARPMQIPPGGPGGETISPSSEALPGGRFLVQWTEGSAGNRAVRAQMLSANLDPIGDPVTLSTPEQNAGQGAVWVHGDTALALFLVKKDVSHELWGASLKCP